jgi:hypothetical protein
MHQGFARVATQRQILVKINTHDTYLAQKGFALLLMLR